MELITQKLNITQTTNNKNHNDSIQAYQLANIGKDKFEFFCNEDSSMAMGFNSRLCIKKYTDSGWVNLVDNRTLGVRFSASMANSKDELIKVFKAFEQYLKELYNIEDLYQVHAVANNELQALYQNMSKIEAEEKYISMCNYWYKEDGVANFKEGNKELELSEEAVFTNYYGSEEYSDTRDNANVTLEMM